MSSSSAAGAAVQPAGHEARPEHVAGASRVDHLHRERGRADFAVRRPDTDCPLRPSVTHTTGAPVSRCSAASAAPSDAMPVYSAGNPSAAMMTSMWRSRPSMPGRTRSTSTTVRVPARRASAAAGGHGRRFVTVHVQHAGGPHGARRHVVGRHRQAGVAVPDDGARARQAVHQDDRELTRGSRHDHHVRDVHALGPQALEAAPAEVVVAEAADVGRGRGPAGPWPRPPRPTARPAARRTDASGSWRWRRDGRR